MFRLCSRPYPAQGRKANSWPDLPDNLYMRGGMLCGASNRSTGIRESERYRARSSATCSSLSSQYRPSCLPIHPSRTPPSSRPRIWSSRRAMAPLLSQLGSSRPRSKSTLLPECAAIQLTRIREKKLYRKIDMRILPILSVRTASTDCVADR
jgi:hypothetical protein